MIMYNKHELEEKIERVIHMLAEESLGGVLVSSQHNFAWLTGGGSNGIDLSREPGAGALLIRNDGRRYIIANNIEMPRLLSEEVSGQGYEPIELSWEEERANSSLIAERAQSVLTNSATLGSDLPISGVARVIEGLLARTRYKLTDAEVERYRALGADVGEVLGEVARSLEPGLSETEIARKAHTALAACGARPVVTLVAADERLANFRHPVPTKRKWEKVVMVAVCARRGGLIVSLTRLVCAGPVLDDLRRRTEATARVNAQLFAATVPGTRGRELYEVAARAYRDVGFAGEQHLHHQGGACGYRTRDWVAHPQSEEAVQPVQAFAWNPSITGTKIEETCIATADDIEVITATPDWPQIAVQVAGREYLLPDVLPL